MSEQSEDRLRAALHGEAERIDGDHGHERAWQDVQRRVRATRTRHRVAAGAMSIAAVLALVLTVTTLVGDGDTAVDVVPADSSSTSTPTTVEPAPAVEPFAGLWPFTSQDEVDAYVADPGIGMFFDAQQTALEFAREYLAMPDPGPSGTATFDTDGTRQQMGVVSRQMSRLVTTVDLERAGGDLDAPWVVVGATTPNIEVDAPTSMDVVGTTIDLAGTSTAFEANVTVEVRDDDGRSLGSTFVMGGANGDMAPFEGEIDIDEPTTPGGAVIFSTESMEDGTGQEATVVRVLFREAEGTAFSVFFHRGEELVEVRRQGAATAGVLRQALEALVAGPRPEDGDGITSLFSEETAGILAGVNLRDGVAVVDLAETVNGASTSAGGAAFRAELDATVFQFPAVERIEYRLRGSCDDFWEWQQLGACRLVPRP